ncbi:MAG: hypothetical protein LJE62_03775 [Silicimonas sp.]|nr:hypothetical protein [Silicimonas sp.]
MPMYNDRFEIGLEEMDLIEDALRDRVKSLSDVRDDRARLENDRKLRSVKSLLGRLHNQKVFYRPKQGYIGG